MILGNIKHAIEFTVDATKDWVIPIPKVEQERMAVWLSANFNGTYEEYAMMRYGL
jgi:hypothetical protein